MHTIKVSGDSEKKALNDKLLQLVSFHLDEEEFGVDILNIQGINRMAEITRVPNSPEYIEGIINLRGRVIPIIDLRRRLGMAEKEPDNNTRIIIVEIDASVIGFVVDSVNEVLRIPGSILEPPPQIIARIDTEYITAVGKLDDRLLILLDLERVLTAKEKDELKGLDID